MKDNDYRGTSSRDKIVEMERQRLNKIITNRAKTISLKANPAMPGSYNEEGIKQTKIT